MHRLSRWAAGAAALLLALPASAADIAETLSLPRASDLVGAKDAPRFAWVETAAGVRNIWIADRGQPARRLTTFTRDDGQEIYDLTFTRDGTRLAYVKGGDAEFPDGKLPNPASETVTPHQQLFVMPVSGGSAMLVGEGHAPVFAPSGDRLAFTHKGEIGIWAPGDKAKSIAKVGGEVNDLNWSPDGTKLLFSDNRGDHAFTGLLDVAANRLTYLDTGLGFSAEPVFSPDGTQAAFIHYVDPPQGAAPDSGPYWSIRIADLASGAVRTLWTAPKGMGGRWQGTRSRNLLWSAEGALVFPWERSGWIHAYAIDAKGGTPRELTPGAFEVEGFVLAPDGRAIVYAGNAGDIDRRHIWRQPLAGGASTRLTQSSGIESFPTFAGNALATIATDVSRPAFPALVEGMKPLGTPAEARGFVTPKPIVFRSEDGVEVHAQLFAAKGPGKHPALVFVHGGPRRQMLLGFHPSGYYSNAYILNQHFAAEGYDVLSINYRSGTGYGQAFREAPGIAREGATEYRDVLAGGRWLAQQGDVDPQRIGIWGGSWGGYLTALALARNSDLFAAGADFHGVHAMVRPVDNTLSPDQQAAAHQLQWQSSPMGSIEKWRSPVLLVHGDDDKNVDFEQSVLLNRELTARGVPHEELVFPNERHEFLRYADWLAAYRATDRFLGAHLMPKAAR